MTRKVKDTLAEKLKRLRFFDYKAERKVFIVTQPNMDKPHRCPYCHTIFAELVDGTRTVADFPLLQCQRCEVITQFVRPDVLQTAKIVMQRHKKLLSKLQG